MTKKPAKFTDEELRSSLKEKARGSRGEDREDYLSQVESLERNDLPDEYELLFFLMERAGFQSATGRVFHDWNEEK